MSLWKERKTWGACSVSRPSGILRVSRKTIIPTVTSTIAP